MNQCAAARPEAMSAHSQGNPAIRDFIETLDPTNFSIGPLTITNSKWFGLKQIQTTYEIFAPFNCLSNAEQRLATTLFDLEPADQAHCIDETLVIAISEDAEKVSCLRIPIHQLEAVPTDP